MEEDSKLTKYILSPSLSGIYVSKSDLQLVAAICGYSLQVQERKRMLKELFALVSNVEDFCKIIDAFVGFFEYKKDMYKGVAHEYPGTTPVVNSLLSRADEALAELKNAKDEAELIS